MSKFVLLVFSTPVDGADTEFNRWYDQEHLPDVLDVPGFVAARRFRFLEAKSSAQEVPDFRYAAIYEIEADDPQTALQCLRGRVQSGQVGISASFDKASVTTFLLEALPLSAG